jgi:hypothetical protein
MIWGELAAAFPTLDLLLPHIPKNGASHHTLIVYSFIFEQRFKLSVAATKLKSSMRWPSR